MRTKISLVRRMYSLACRLFPPERCKSAVRFMLLRHENMNRRVHKRRRPRGGKSIYDTTKGTIALLRVLARFQSVLP